MLVKKDRVKIQLSGVFDIEWFDAAGNVTSRERIHNAATLAGLTHLLSTEYAAGTPITQWFLGLISNTSFTEVSQDDTMSSHAGWTEATAYQDATRPQWTPLACAAGIITNSSQVVFVASSAMVLRGIFLTSSSTKGGTTGTLATTGLFGSTRTLAAGNGFRLTYTMVATGGNV